MPANKKLLFLPGDGIGPEVMRQVRRVIDWLDRKRNVTFDVISLFLLYTAAQGAATSLLLRLFPASL